MANVLTEMGVQKGDRVCIYLPMIPELAVTMLACAKMGAVHSVIFAGFSLPQLLPEHRIVVLKLLYVQMAATEETRHLTLKVL